jgi:regulator of PEP synthase PpsR (kinase-PPPase family)
MNKKYLGLLEDVVNDKSVNDEEIIAESSGKRGRPANDSDESGKGGVRDIMLTAKIKYNGKTEERKKKLTDVNVDDIDKEKDKFEKQVNKEFDYDADVTVKVNIGKYEASADAEDYMTADDDGADGSDDSGYSLGRKEK